jgi:hypothetical protein
MRYLALILFEIALTTYCVVDVLRHEEDSPHGLHKIVWIFVLLLFPLVPDLVWLYLKWRSSGEAKPRPRGPVAPDDDPEYLRWLSEQGRRRREER